MKLHRILLVSAVLAFGSNSALAISLFDLTYGEGGDPDHGPGGGEPFVVGDLTFFGFEDFWGDATDPGTSVPSMQGVEVSPVGEGTNRQGLVFEAGSLGFFTGMGNPLDWGYGDIRVVSTRPIAGFSFELLSYAVHDPYVIGSPLIEFEADFTAEGAADGTIELVVTDTPEQSVLSGELDRYLQAGDEMELTFYLTLNAADAAELGVSSWAVHFTLVPEPSTIVIALIGLGVVLGARRSLARR